MAKRSTPTPGPFGGPASGLSGPVLDPATAKQIAIHLHYGQTDKAGEPYAKHVVAVGDMVALLGGSPDEVIAGYLHDTIEDEVANVEGLRSFGATDTTMAIIFALTKHKGEHNDISLQRVLDAGPGACRVKLADLLHNTRHDRVNALLELATNDVEAERKIYQRLDRYQRWIRAIMVELGLLGPEVGIS